MDDSSKSNVMVSNESGCDDTTSKLSIDQCEASNDEGVDVEGDVVFDPLDDPMNESDDESRIAWHEEDWVP